MFMSSALALSLLSQSFDTPGPHPVASALAQSLAIPSGAIDADLYWPTDTTGPVPIAIVGHGFARSAAALTNWGAHLASYGIVTAVPSFPRPLMPDHAANADRMREMIALLRTSAGPITAMIDPNRSAVVGHSAGGLSALLAAADDPSINVIVGLDPVDANGLGAGRVAAITQPVLVLGADSSTCNGNGSAGVLYPGIVANGSWYLHVAGATHCDGEDPSNATCSSFCGGEDPMRRALFRRYATAHLLAWLECSGLDYLPGGSGLTADLNAAVVDGLQMISGDPCAAPADAGVPPIQDAGLPFSDAAPAETGGPGEDAAELADAGPLDVESADSTSEDAVVASDAGGARDAENAQPIPDGRRDSDGCSCDAADIPAAPSELAGLLILGLLFSARRRRHTVCTARRS